MMAKPPGRVLRQALKTQQRLAHTEQQRALAALLDELNAWDVLEHARDTLPVRAFGPRTISKPGVLALVVWWAGAGFHGYKRLALLGVWCTVPGHVSAGRKVLPYSAATYNPESYHRLIQKNYTAYYTDDASPPARPIITFDYQPENRIAQRQALQKALS